MPIQLVVSNTVQASEAKAYAFNKEVITIGRDPSCDLQLWNNDRVVSKRHAEIRYREGTYELTDLFSKNQTYVNGTPLQPGQPYALEAGDRFRIGPFDVRFAWVGDAASPLPDQPAPGAALHTSLTSLPAGDAPALSQREATLLRAISEMSMLNELAAEIGASGDVRVIINTVVQRARTVIGAEQGLISLMDRRAPDATPSGTLSPVGLHTMIRVGEEEPLHLNERLLAWMQEHKRPLLTNNPHADEVFGFMPWDRGIRSILCVPLMVRSRLTGILTLFNKKSASGFGDHDQRLLSIIAGQSAQIIENARLHEEEKQMLHVQDELRLAYDIQTKLLPAQAPLLDGYDIAARSIPAQTVGGDYYDFIPIEDGSSLALCVGDVSGKGLPAALLMSNVQATLRGQLLWTNSPEECLKRANALLCRSTNRNTFVTLFLGHLDPARHVLRYANAGHNRPLLLRADGELVVLRHGSLVLGFLDHQSYRERDVAINPGDVLLIYTDGASEAMNAGREQFGDARLAAVLRQYRNEPAARQVEYIAQAIRAFTGPEPQSDDITLMVLRRQ